MTNTIYCSIIVPVFNEQENLPAQLEVLQAWRQAGHEVIVVDGGSTDASVELAKPHVDKLLYSKKGRALQMNMGAAHASHDWYLFLHVDTFLPGSAINSLQQVFHAPSIRWGRFDVRLSGNTLVFSLIAGLMNIRSRLTGIATGDQAIFVARKSFEQVGGFPAIPLMEDITISRYLKKLAAPCCLSDTVTTSSRRWREHGVLRTVCMMWLLRLRYFFGTSPIVLAARYNQTSK